MGSLHKESVNIQTPKSMQFTIHDDNQDVDIQSLLPTLGENLSVSSYSPILLWSSLANLITRETNTPLKLVKEIVLYYLLD
jgi:hypothetical protein